MNCLRIAVWGLLACWAQIAAAQSGAPLFAGPPLPPTGQAPPIASPSDEPAPGDLLPDATTSPGQLPYAEQPSSGMVFAPYPGKSPCGEFDSPYSNYFGDTRIWRSVVLGRAWAEMEYLAWASQPTHLPALVSTSPLGTDPADAGILGPTGSVLFGDERTQNTLRSGARVNMGYWFTPEHLAGVELRLLWLSGRPIDQFAAGGDDLILATPFVDANSGLNSAALISYPGLLDGQVRVRSNMQLFGTEVLGRHLLTSVGCSRLDFIAGYRYLWLGDTVRTDSLALSLDDSSGFDADTLIARTDGFASRNEFHGGEFGLVYRWWNCCWALNLTGKVALGGTRTTSRVGGSTTLISPTNDVTTTSGGILAQPSNIGVHTQSEFAAVGDLGVKLEYAATPQLRLTLGYNWMCWSSVARIGDSIDTTVDPTQIAPGTNPAATRPGFAFHNTSFWSHGLTLGGYYDF